MGERLDLGLRRTWKSLRDHASKSNKLTAGNKFKNSILAAFTFAAAGGCGEASAAQDCSSLISSTLPNAKVTSAAMVSGTVVGPDGKTYTNLPPFCSVSILATPSSDSLINILLWLPTNWNGRFEGTGNGGYAGNMAIDGPAMVYAIQNGIAVAANDLGTSPSANNNGDSLIGHPQKWIDFGYRATHVMTTLSKSLIQTYYGSMPKWSYFAGCSTGGQQALMLAQRYPADYDGIVGGDPAHFRTHTHIGIQWIYAQSHVKPTSMLTPDLVTLVTNSVVAACAVKSGGLATDKFLTDDTKCKWSPETIQCKSTGQTNCLNADQVAAVSAIYKGPRVPSSGATIFPGSARGSEAASLFGWNDTQSGNEPQFDSIFKWAFGPTWQSSNFNYESDLKDMDTLLGKYLNANSPDLSAFRSRGGKLIMYQGTADPLIAPQNIKNYFTRVVGQIGGGLVDQSSINITQSFFRLFMVPGMNHCSGGNGPNSFGNQFSSDVVNVDPPSNDAAHHALTALMQWVEKGTAPSQIIATKYNSDTPSLGVAFQRPLCPYPAWPAYNGLGDPNSASSFTCK